MGKLVSLMHTSLDGFVGGPHGEIDWIVVNEDMFEISTARTNEADVALYGRVTYQMMDNYWPNAPNKPNATKHDFDHSAWYTSVKKVVVSKTMEGANIPNTAIISDDIPAAIKQLKQTTDKNILMLGSPSIMHILTEESIIDEYWIFINPILVGEGIPLFKNIKKQIKLHLVSSKIITGGVICLHYTKA